MTLEQFKAERGLRLSQLAKLLDDRPVSTVHGWLTRRRHPSGDDVRMIEAKTGGAVTAADLLPDVAKLFRSEAA